jgi:hypothetical protein
MNNDILHQQAVKLLVARQATNSEVNAKGVAKSYNQRRREATAALRPILIQIWEAFDRGESVGGFTGKEAWCAGQSIGIRHCQKIVEGPKPKANSVRPTCAKCAKLEEKIETMKKANLALVDVNKALKEEVRLLKPAQRKRILADRAQVAAPKRQPKKLGTSKAYLADVRAAEEEYNARRQKEMEEATVRCSHGDDRDDDCLICFPVDQPTVTPAPSSGPMVTHKEDEDGSKLCNGKRGGHLTDDEGIDPVTCARCLKKMTTVTPAAKPKSPLQRLRAAMRAAKFYAGMMDELVAVQDMGNDYTRLLTLHDGRYPWTPPTKTYSLPPTEEEFQAEWDAAMKEFDEVMAVKAPTVTREGSK